MKTLIRWLLQWWRPAPRMAIYTSLLIMVAALDDEYAVKYRKIRFNLDDPTNMAIVLMLLVKCLEEQERKN